MMKGSLVLTITMSSLIAAQQPTPRPAPAPPIAPSPAPLLDLLEGAPSLYALERLEGLEGLEGLLLHVEKLEFDAMPELAGLALHGAGLEHAIESVEHRFEGLHFEELHFALAGPALAAADLGLLRAPRPEGGPASAPRSAPFVMPDEPRHPDDPADSLYRAAREMLNRGEYRRAAETFRSISERFSSSKYAPDALYWEAFALYRIGTIADTRAALAALERLDQRFPRVARQSDAKALATRIRGELAANGDDRARAQLAADARRRQQPGCDREEMAVRVEALSALSKLESEATLPALRQVLARTDECSASLRRRAIFLLGRQHGQEAEQLLVRVARSDPDREVRESAISWLGRSGSDLSLTTLRELVQQQPVDGSVVNSALRALVAHPNPEGRRIVRQLILRSEVAEDVRSDAISALSKDATAEDGAFLRDIYPRVESRKLKERVILTVSRIEDAENAQWLSAIARSENEPVALRAAAVSRIAISAPIAEVIRLYDTLPQTELREQLIMRLGSRKEPEAVDKLLAIARSDADPQLRRAAISRLAQKKDPRTTELLLEIISQ